MDCDGRLAYTIATVSLSQCLGAVRDLPDIFASTLDRLESRRGSTPEITSQD